MGEIMLDFRNHKVIALNIFYLVIIEAVKLFIFGGLARLLIEILTKYEKNITGIIIMAISFVIVVWLLDYALAKLRATSKIKLYLGTFRTTLHLMCIYFIYMAYTQSEFSYENMHSVELVNAVWIMLLLDQVFNLYLQRYRELRQLKVSELDITSKIIPFKRSK